MKKLMLVPLIGAALICGKKPPTLENSTISEKYVSADGGLNVRETPDLNGKKITTLAKGTKVTILESKSEIFKVGDASGSWTKVTDGKIQGWAFSGFLTAVAPAVQPGSSDCSKAKEKGREDFAACKKTWQEDNARCAREPGCDGVALGSACGSVDMQIRDEVAKVCGSGDYD